MHEGGCAAGTATAAEETAPDVVHIPISLLVPAESPRLGGIDEKYARTLAQSEGALPPILVQRDTMRVIDGMHRLRARQLGGHRVIAAQLLDLDDKSTYLRAVTANVRHGLPLTLAERRAAAVRLLQMYPDWSDRSLGRAAGLSGKTVGTLRLQVGGVRPTHRVGRDGRVRPVSVGAAHHLVSELLAAHPAASLREIARAANVSPNTVRRVRERLGHAGARLEPPQRRAVPQPEGGPARDDTILASLRRDPSLRYSEPGRVLLRALHSHLGTSLDRRTVEALPPHCLPGLASLARSFATRWKDVSDLVESRMRADVPHALPGEAHHR